MYMDVLYAAAQDAQERRCTWTYCQEFRSLQFLSACVHVSDAAAQDAQER